MATRRPPTRNSFAIARWDLWAINPSTILDLGCGQGVCSEKINLKGRTYTGVEPSPFLLERATALYPHKYFVAGNAYALPFADKTFDAVFSIAVWHLLEDKLKAASELSRVLREGGHFMIVAANPEAYEEWTKSYSSSTRKGRRFEGRMIQSDASESTDVLYLHSYDEIIASLQAAQLEIEGATTFRTALCLRGKKRRSPLL